MRLYLLTLWIQDFNVTVFFHCGIASFTSLKCLSTLSDAFWPAVVSVHIPARNLWDCYWTSLLFSSFSERKKVSQNTCNKDPGTLPLAIGSGQGGKTVSKVSHVQKRLKAHFYFVIMSCWLLAACPISQAWDYNLQQTSSDQVQVIIMSKHAETQEVHVSW